MSSRGSLSKIMKLGRPPGFHLPQQDAVLRINDHRRLRRRNLVLGHNVELLVLNKDVDHKILVLAFAVDQPDVADQDRVGVFGLSEQARLQEQEAKEQDAAP